MYTENRGVKPQSGCVQTEPNPKIYFLPTGTFQVKKGVFSTLIYLSCLGRITSHRSTLLNTSSDAQGTRVFSIRDSPYSEVGVSMGGRGRWRWVQGSFSPGCMILGFAPKYARFTLAFLPSMMGLGSLQALSAAARSAMVTLATYTQTYTQSSKSTPEESKSRTGEVILIGKTALVL